MAGWISTCHANMKTRVWIPSVHVNVTGWVCQPLYRYTATHESTYAYMSTSHHGKNILGFYYIIKCLQILVIVYI